MTQKEKNIDKYTEILQQNSLKGETYFVKFQNDPIVYMGIPLQRSGLSTEDKHTFSLQVLEPVEKKGMYSKSITDIELLEKS